MKCRSTTLVCTEMEWKYESATLVFTALKWKYGSTTLVCTALEWKYESATLICTALEWKYKSAILVCTTLEWKYGSATLICTSRVISTVLQHWCALHILFSLHINSLNYKRKIVQFKSNINSVSHEFLLILSNENNFVRTLICKNRFSIYIKLQKKRKNHS